MIEASGVHKIYDHLKNQVHVLKGIDLKIPEGSIFAVIGPSGAGKSTLLHVLGGLDNPTKGKVLFAGEDLYSLNDVQLSKVRNSQIGFVFQFYYLLPEFTALENVILPGIVKDDEVGKKKLEEKGLDLLEQVGLKQRATHRPYQLSGGEQQRVAIARALINEPKVLFCDEPTGNLDSETGNEIIEILKELNRKNKQTLVVVTHDESIAQVSHKVIHLRDGELI